MSEGQEWRVASEIIVRSALRGLEEELACLKVGKICLGAASGLINAVGGGGVFRAPTPEGGP